MDIPSRFADIYRLHFCPWAGGEPRAGRARVLRSTPPKAGHCKSEGEAMSIPDLTAHAVPYLTIGQLAGYLHVSRRQILKQIQSGSLPAVRLGPRLYRIPVSAAREFERRSVVVAQHV
jgi:excisionase family DNA binding protein